MADEEVGTVNVAKRFEPVELQAIDISYSVADKKILRNVSATFAPASMAALMGPSGAGKTTLLNVLCGRVSGSLSGRVLVNGRQMSNADYRGSITLMPQADLLHAALTVEQCIFYAAQLRCPPYMMAEDKVAAAEKIIDIMGLAKVRKNTIGDEHNAGISGGQRKRVSACIEFLSNRPVLFMDEPTSGLDSATARVLMQHLSAIARQEGRTVVAVVHQPAWTIMSLFESVVLLAKGGRVCFRGPPNGIPTFFAANGVPCPDTENPADHMLYVLSEPGAPEKWATTWAEDEGAKKLAVEPTVAGDTLAPQFPIPFSDQYKILTRRTMLVYVSDTAQMKTQFQLLFGTLIVLGLQMVNAPYTVSLANAILFYGLLLYMASTLQIVIIMPMERSVVLREYRNGTYSVLAYWLSRVTLSAVVGIFQALLATLIIYPMLGLPDHPARKIFTWYACSYMLLVTLNVFGMFLGVILPSAMISIKAVPTFMTLWIIGSGFMPPHNRMRPGLAWLRIPQPLSYALKIFVIEAFDNGQDQAQKILEDSRYLDINPGNEASCFLALFICCLLYTSPSPRDVEESRMPSSA